MNDIDHSLPATDHDASLLEGLYQLAVSGNTDGWEFEQINSEVYARLQDTYASAEIGSGAQAFAA